MRETFTSIAENIGEYAIEGSGAVLRVIDIPGHERLRGRFFDQYKATTKGLIFVIDSVTVQKDVRDVAEYVLNCVFVSKRSLIVISMLSSYLYTILAEQSVSRVPILIACNKQDETLAKGSSVVKGLLEKEL